MKKTLHLKFVLAYLVFGLLAFLAVSTVSSRMTYRYLIRKEAGCALHGSEYAGLPVQ